MLYVLLQGCIIPYGSPYAQYGHCSKADRRAKTLRPTKFEGIQLSEVSNILLNELGSTFGHMKPPNQGQPGNSNALRLSFFKATLEELEQVDPFGEPSENYKYLFPIVLAVGLRFEADARTPSIMHHFFWPLWSNSPLYKNTDFSDEEKNILWRCVQHIFTSDGMLSSDDPYWIKHSAKLKLKILRM